MNGSYTYNGGAQIPDLTVVLAGQTLIKDTDYTVAAEDNTHAGTAQYTITGKETTPGPRAGHSRYQRQNPYIMLPRG